MKITRIKRCDNDIDRISFKVKENDSKNNNNKCAYATYSIIQEELGNNAIFKTRKRTLENNSNKKLAVACIDEK